MKPRSFEAVNRFLIYLGKFDRKFLQVETPTLVPAAGNIYSRYCPIRLTPHSQSYHHLFIFLIFGEKSAPQPFNRPSSLRTTYYMRLILRVPGIISPVSLLTNSVVSGTGGHKNTPSNDPFLCTKSLGWSGCGFFFFTFTCNFFTYQLGRYLVR